MRYAYALKAPAAGWKPPAFLKDLTPSQILWGAVALAGLLAVSRMARAIGHLARAAAKAAAAPAAAASGGSGGGIKLKPLLLLAALVGGGLWLVSAARHGTAAAAGKPAAPAPSPSPLPHPTPTVTRTVTPHAAPHLPSFAFLDHLTGTDWTVIVVFALLVAFAIVRPLLHRSGS